MSIHEAKPTISEQSAIQYDAIADDILSILEGNRRAAEMAYKREMYWATRIQQELRKQYGWTVNQGMVEDIVVNDLGPKTVKACARPHPDY